MPSPYNDVEITDDDKQAIYENPGIKEDQNPLEAGVDGVPTKDIVTHETDSQEEPTEVGTEGATEASESEEFNLEDYEVEINGETYDGADIIKWQEDSTNNEDWQKSNTQKAQEIAKWSKLTEKISSDDEFKEYVKDYFYDDDKGLKSLGLDGNLNPLAVEEASEEAAEEKETPLNDVSKRLETIEMERAIDELEGELEGIISKNETLFEDEDAEIDFLEFVEDTGMTNLDNAFKVWAYDQIQGELDHHRKLDGNKQRNQGKVVHNSEIGATEVSTPKNYKDIKDISYDDPDVRKYFDN